MRQCSICGELLFQPLPNGKLVTPAIGTFTTARQELPPFETQVLSVSQPASGKQLNCLLRKHVVDYDAPYRQAATVLTEALCV